MICDFLDNEYNSNLRIPMLSFQRNKLTAKSKGLQLYGLRQIFPPLMLQLSEPVAFGKSADLFLFPPMAEFPGQ